MWVSPPGSGDHTADTAATAWSATGSHWGYFTDILTGLDVTAPGNPGTVAVLGTNTDRAGRCTGSRRGRIGARQVAVGLANALRGNSQGVPDFGVVEGGIEGNAVMRDINGAGGPSALSRLDRDILDEPGIGTVVVAKGSADMLAGTSADDLEDAYTTLATQLNAWGITAVFMTMTPCDGYTRAPRRTIASGRPPTTGSPVRTARSSAVRQQRRRQRCGRDRRSGQHEHAARAEAEQRCGTGRRRLG